METVKVLLAAPVIELPPFLSVPALTVKSPAVARDALTVQAPPEPLKIKLLNCELPFNVPDKVLPVVVESKVTVPLE